MFYLVFILLAFMTLRILPFINVDASFRLQNKIKEFEKWLKDQKEK